MRATRSVGAVLAGMIAGIVLSLGTDMGLRAAGIFPPFGPPVSDSLYLLGGLGLVVCIVGLVVTWGKGPEFGPKWYPISLVVLAMPSAWVGGKLSK